MKKSHLKLVIFQVLLIFIIFFYSFVLNNNISNFYNIVFWLLSFLFLKFYFGYEKDKSLLKKDILIDVFIFVFGYLIFEYLLGLLLGFVKNPYSLNIVSVIKNIFPLIVLIFLEELSRYIIMIKGKGSNLVFIVSLILFVSFDISTSLKLYNLSTNFGVFNFITLVILASISKNFLLNFIAKEAGYKPCLLYRMVLELIIYIVPIYTALGDYLSAVFKIVFPLILFLKISKMLKFTNKKIVDTKVVSKILFGILSFVLIILVYLTSNCFKYYMLVIASNSMNPNIAVGDAVVIEKLNGDELNKIDVQDVLVYKYDNKIIVHRVVNIFKIDNKYVFQTKGDNNKDYDEWLIYEDDVIGIVKNKIIGIGYPSVLLNKYINN